MKLKINYLLLFALIISIFLYYPVFNSINGKLKKTLYEISHKQKLEINNKERLAKSQKLYASNRELFTEIYKVYEKLPKYDEIKQIITDLEYLARENSIMIRETSIEPFQKYFSSFSCPESENNISEEGLKELVYCEFLRDIDMKYVEENFGLTHIKLVLEGSFENLLRFFNALQRNVYFLPIESITISRNEEGNKKINFFINLKLVLSLKDFWHFLKIEYPFINVSKYKNLSSDTYFEQFLTNSEGNLNESLFKSEVITRNKVNKEEKANIPLLPTIFDNKEKEEYESDKKIFVSESLENFKLIKPEFDKRKEVIIKPKFKEENIRKIGDVLNKFKVLGTVRYEGIGYVIVRKKNKLYILRENELIDNVKINKVLLSSIEVEIEGEKFNYELE